MRARRACGAAASSAVIINNANTPSDTHQKVLPAGTMATMDYNDQRVRLWLGADGKVQQTPRIG